MHIGLLVLKALQINPHISSSQLADKMNNRVKLSTTASYLSIYDRAGLITYELIPMHYSNSGRIFRNVKYYTINEKGLQKIAKLEEIEKRKVIEQSRIMLPIQNKLPFENEVCHQKPQNNPLTELQHKYEILLAGFIGLKENVKNGKSLEQSILHMGSKFEELLLNK